MCTTSFWLAGLKVEMLFSDCSKDLIRAGSRTPLPGQVVDLGAIGGLGWLEENKEDLKFVETTQNLIVGADEFYVLMKSAMTGYSHGEYRVPTQIVTGAGSGGLNKANRAAGAQIDYYWLNESPHMSYLRLLYLNSTLQAEECDEMGEFKGSLTTVTTLTQATDLIQNVVASNWPSR